jgi:multidrug efflux pump subunit AcrA (membrane-fusion protein)
VGEVFLVPGQVAPISIPAVSVTRAVRVVTGELPVADLDLLVVGQRVDIELPDETVLSGTVREVGDVARTGSGQNSEAVVDFVIEADDDPDRSQLVVAPVTVRVLEDEIRGAIAIPVPSLIAVAEGGYAVEIVDGAERRLVLVELGFYADSWVEVTNGAVTVGEMVVVAR